MTTELEFPSIGRSSGQRPLRVTVLAGGPSAERSVSLESGKAIAEALRRCGHSVFISDIGPGDLAALDHPADVVFSALHGTFGEDGELQQILEARRIPFVGSDARTSAVTIDKIETKRRVAAAGIDTPPFEHWTAATATRGRLPEIPLPVIVKPVDQGSSVATTIVREASGFETAVQLTLNSFGQALVEGFVQGDELTVGILDGRPLPPICVRPRREFYDFAAKYEDDATEYLFDFGHSPAVGERAMSLSQRVFDLLGCRHLARIDWMIDRDGRLWFLEVNTLPGFTSHSLVPKAAARVGIGFEDLVERLVRLAVGER